MPIIGNNINTCKKVLINFALTASIEYILIKIFKKKCLRAYTQAVNSNSLKNAPIKILSYDGKCIAKISAISLTFGSFATALIGYHIN